MLHLVIAADLPDPLKSKVAIEAHLREAFGGLPGDWMIQLRHAQVPTWWTLVIRRAEDGFKRTLVLDPTKQSPAYVAGAVGEILREIRAAGPA